MKAARAALTKHRLNEDGRDEHIVRLPVQATIELHRAIALEAQHDIRQLVILRNEVIDPHSFEYQVWREAAIDGVTCSKLYLLPHSGFSEDAVAGLLRADRDSGITANLLVMSKIGADVQMFYSGNLWLIDHQTVVFGAPSGECHQQIWTVTDRDEDVQRADAFWTTLIALSQKHSETPSQKEVDLEEPLVLSADLVHGVAPVLCTSDHVDSFGCEWYHGTWQYLRLLNMVSTPTWHSQFYTKASDSSALVPTNTENLNKRDRRLLDTRFRNRCSNKSRRQARYSRCRSMRNPALRVSLVRKTQRDQFDNIRVRHFRMREASRWLLRCYLHRRLPNSLPRGSISSRTTFLARRFTTRWYGCNNGSLARQGGSHKK